MSQLKRGECSAIVVPGILVAVIFTSFASMPKSEMSSRDTLRPLTAAQEERRRTGRYAVGGTALAVTLLAFHHVLLRNASTLAGIFVPIIIMTVYVLWVLYSARKDRRKAARRALAMELTDVISSPSPPIHNNVTNPPEFKKQPQDIT